MECLYVSAVSCAVLLDRTGHYEASVPCRLTLNGREIGEERRAFQENQTGGGFHLKLFLRTPSHNDGRGRFV